MALDTIRPIVGVTPRVQEIGRIRMGAKKEVQTKNGTRTVPDKLDTFRLTSDNRAVLDAAAALYGGRVARWEDAPDEGMWQVTTAAAELDILIPRSLRSVSQWWELWQGGTCMRRCDGATEQVTGGACLCGDARGEDGRKDVCDVVTRLSVILPRLPGLGLWRLDTGGWFAASTIPSTIDLLLALDQRPMVPAVLRAVQASKRERDAEGRVQTHRFVKPVLDAPGITIGQMVDTGPTTTTAALPETVERPRPMTAVERAQARAAAVTDAPAPSQEPATGSPVASTGGTSPAADHAPEPGRTTPAASGAPEPDILRASGDGEGGDSAPPPSPEAAPKTCGSPSPYEDGGSCNRPAGHAERIYCTDGRATWPRPKDWR